MDVTAVILCGSPGERMHPLTGSSLDDFSDSTPSQDQSIDDVVPKCLLPVAATTPLSLLLKALEIAGIDLKENTLVLSAVEISPNLRSYLAKKHPGVPFAELPVTSNGSADALRFCKTSARVPPHHHIMLLPSDLILESASSLIGLYTTHLNAFNEISPCTQSCGGLTMLLADVGMEDEQDKPVKESKKAKQNKLVREDEEIEFIGYSTPSSSIYNPTSLPPPPTSSTPTPPSLHTPSNPPNRILLKKQKAAVEETEDQDTGETPKLIIPKSLIRASSTCLTSFNLRTDLLDLHCYMIAPRIWSNLLFCQSFENKHSMQDQIIPLIIDKQLLHYPALFKMPPAEFLEAFTSPSTTPPTPPSPICLVNAHILPRNSTLSMRVCTVANYLLACRESVSHSIRPPKLHPASLPSTFGRLEGTVHAKDNSLLGEGTTKGSGGAVKNSTIGANVSIGSKCKINNCVVMDDVVIKDGCTLQNSIICKKVTVEQNCNLNNCQVASAVVVAQKSKLTDEVVYAAEK
ncbi:hypothetical protein TrCOL_g3432 [Triparma columacea]|uniref:Translation initiation factor eIF2B subunit gamma n=1 Tax=Triparma columacea TaxID=722753 RepID=A0A9W7GE37_9STRA|nr:hypothetical protein TrCOL_g3432 [Triparma columacea]